MNDNARVRRIEDTCRHDGTIQVQNAEGEPDTAAYVVAQGQINFVPKVSVIIPVHNTEKYLKQCLDSVINQTLKEIEIICVNDGSTDDSLKVLKECAKKDDRVVIINQTHQRQGCSRNNALKIARGEYVQFVDSDDLIREDTCERLYKKAKEYDLDMLCFSGYNFSETPKKRQENTYWSYDKVLSSLDGKKVFNMRDIKEIAHRMVVSACLTVFRNSFLIKYDIRFPEKLYYEDNVFYVKSLTKAARISIDSEEYYIRRIRKDSVTQNWDKHFADYFEVADMVLEYLKNIRIDKSIYNNYKRSYLSMCVKLFRTYGQTASKKNYLTIKNLIAKYGRLSEYHLNYSYSHPLLIFASFPHTFFKYRALKRRLCQYIWARMSTLCIDVKILSNKKEAIQIEAQGSTIIERVWCGNTQGERMTLTSSAPKGKIKISTVKAGELTVNFCGPDVRFEGKKFPVWIDYKSISINGKDVLSSPVETWHGKPWSYKMSVEDGQEIWLEYEQQAHSYSRKELKETILKLNPSSEVIQENIDVLIDQIKKMIKHVK